MRNAFIDELIKLARKDKRIILVTGDLGYGIVDQFQKEFPKRYLNAGVAEQNMLGLAAGLALEGKIPYVFSIATFPILRAFEQLRNDICYQNLNVKIVGVGCGLTYSLYGATHQSIDDLAVTRALPNLTVICPGDPIESKLATRFALEHQGPVYLRLAAKGDPIIHQKEPKFKLGQAILIEPGRDLTVLATSNMLANAKGAVDRLKAKGLLVRFISVPFIKPIDQLVILKAARETKAIFTVEEHSLIGGLGAAVAEVLAESKYNPLFRRLSLPDIFVPEVGGWSYLRGIYGLLPEKIAERIFKEYQKIR